MAPPNTERQRILDELNRLRRAVVPADDETDPLTQLATSALVRGGVSGATATFIVDPLTKPLKHPVVDQLIAEVVDEVMRTSTISVSRDSVTREVEQLLLAAPTTAEQLSTGTPFDLAVRAVTDAQNLQLQTFPGAPTEALRLRAYVKALESKEALNPGSTGMTPERSNAILNSNDTSIPRETLVEARRFLESADVDALFDTALSVRQRFDPTGEFKANPQDATQSLFTAIGTFEKDAIRRGETPVPNTFLPPAEVETRVAGLDQLIQRATPSRADAALTQVQFTNLVDTALRQEGVSLDRSQYPAGKAGDDQFAAVKRARDQILSNAKDFAATQTGTLPIPEFAQALASFVQGDAGNFEQTREQAATDITAAAEAEEAADLAETGVSPAEVAAAISAASKGLLTPADINAERQRPLRQKLVNGEQLTAVDVVDAFTKTVQDKAAEDAETLATDKSAATTKAEDEIFRLSSQDGKGILSKTSFSEGDFNDAVEKVAAGQSLDIGQLRRQAGRFAFEEGQADTEEANIEAVSRGAVERRIRGLTGFDQDISGIVDEAVFALENIRADRPFAPLDVETLLPDILGDIDEFQTEEDFAAEQRRIASPESALRIRQDLDAAAEEERFALDDQGLPIAPPPTPIGGQPLSPLATAQGADFDILGGEQPAADVTLPPGVPGVPSLDAGIVESDVFQRQQDAALEQSIITPEAADLENIAAAASGGNPELQAFILQNLDLGALQMGQETESQRRRQAAFGQAERLGDPAPTSVFEDLINEGVDLSKLSPEQRQQLMAQQRQREASPLFTGEQQARFADRDLPRVEFEPIFQQQIPELVRRFEQSPAEVSRRQTAEQRRLQDVEDEQEQARRDRETSLRRGGRVVFTGLQR